MKIKVFEVKQSKRNGQFRAYAIGANGKKVWWTEHYQREVKAVEAIRLLDPEGLVPVDFFDKNGNWTSTLERIDGAIVRNKSAAG